MASGIRGWVYVLSNKAMPGLLKIGHSTKDPNLRLEDLSTTGLPHAFVVEYDVLLEGPREVEQAVHRRLKDTHEAKEFFRVPLHVAIAAIRTVASDQRKSLLSEFFRSPLTGPIPTPPNDAGASQPKRPNPTYCPTCKRPVRPDESRCPVCFTLIH